MKAKTLGTTYGRVFDKREYALQSSPLPAKTWRWLLSFIISVSSNIFDLFSYSLLY